MKKLLISLIDALALGATLPARAGPDWQAIEQARKAKQASQFGRHGDAAERPAAGPATCSTGAARPAARPRAARADHALPQPAAQGTLRDAGQGLPGNGEVNPTRRQPRVVSVLHDCSAEAFTPYR